MHRIAKNALAAAATGSLFLAPAWGADPEPATYRFHVGLTFVSGMSDLQDKIEANNPQVTTTTLSPVGLSASLYRRFGSNWGITGSVGPIVLGIGDASFTIVPFGLSGRYDILYGDRVSPYVRLGIEKALVSGDFVEDGGIGSVAALGVDFSPPDQGGFGIELALRTLEVNVPGRPPATTKAAQPFKGSLTLYWAF